MSGCKIRFVVIKFLALVAPAILAQPNTHANPVKISISLFGPPNSYYDAEGKPTGIYVDYFRELEKTTGLTFETTLLPYKRTLLHLEKGLVDATPLFHSKERQQTFHMVAQITNQPVGVVAKASFPLKSRADLQALTIGTLRGGRYDREFDHGVDLTKQPVNNYNQGIKMLEIDRINAMAGALVTIYSKLFDHKMTVGPPLLFKPKQVWIMWSRLSTLGPEYREKIRQGTATLNKAKRFEAIQNRYVRDFSKIQRLIQAGIRVY